MKLRRVAALSLVAALLVTGMWVVGGNMWAARREEQCEIEWTATFGSLDDLKKKYPKHGTNETARKLEELTRSGLLGFDLTPGVSVEDWPGGDPSEWKKSQGMFDFLLAELAKSEAVIDPPPEEATRFLEEKRTDLDTIEGVLIAGPPPQWSFDLSLPENDRLMPNGLGEIRLQRALMARALTAANAGRHAAAAHSLEASWNLNESLRGRPETISVLLGIAIARLEVGALRKVNVQEGVWRKRLATLDGRASLLDALVLDSRRRLSKTWWRITSKSAGDSSWFERARNFLTSPADRLAMVDYSNLMREELVQLRGAPLLDRFPPASTPRVLDPAHTITSISMPNIQNSFLRAARLFVDAELTSKILEAKRLRKKNGGHWPATIPGIEGSRYPDASWRYEVAPDGRMSLAFSRELQSPFPTDGRGALPLRFSSD